MYKNPKSDLEETIQINTLHHIQLCCNMNRFRNAQPTDVSAQFKASVASLNGEVKFFKFIDNLSWPDGMDTIKKNLLRSMILDEEVVPNKRNSFTVIDSLRAALQRFDLGMLDICGATVIRTLNAIFINWTYRIQIQLKERRVRVRRR